MARTTSANLRPRRRQAAASPARAIAAVSLRSIEPANAGTVEPEVWPNVESTVALDELRQRGVRAGEHNRSRRRRESRRDRVRVRRRRGVAYASCVGVCSIVYDELIAVLLLRQQRGHVVQPAPGLWNGRAGELQRAVGSVPLATFAEVRAIRPTSGASTSPMCAIRTPERCVNRQGRRLPLRTNCESGAT